MPDSTEERSTLDKNNPIRREEIKGGNPLIGVSRHSEEKVEDAPEEKPSFLVRFFGELATRDYREIGRDLVQKTVKPSIYDLAYSVVESAARAVFTPSKGQNRSRSNCSERNSMTDRKDYRQAREEKRPSSVADYVAMICFETRNDALESCGGLNSHMEEYGIMTLGDLLRFGGIDPEPTHENWGWDSSNWQELDYSNLYRGNSDGLWHFRLPKAKIIDR